MDPPICSYMVSKYESKNAPATEYGRHRLAEMITIMQKEAKAQGVDQDLYKPELLCPDLFKLIPPL